MSANPFVSAREYLNFLPLPKWAALLASALASLMLFGLLPVIYLAVDLMSTHGRVSTYNSLTASQQADFRQMWTDELSSKPSMAEKLQKLGIASISETPTVEDWEARHTIATHESLANLVSKDAAETYFPLESLSPSTKITAPDELGLLATVANNRSHYSARLFGKLAQWNSWTWKPNGNRSANGQYILGLLIIGLVLIGLRGLLLNLASYCSTIATIEAGARLRRAIITHSQRLNSVAVRAEEQAHVGKLVSKDVESIERGLGAWLTGVWFRFVVILVLLVLLLAGYFWLSMAILCLAALVWLVAGQAAARFRRDARLADRRVEGRLGMMKESLTAMTLSKAYLMERFSQTRFERHNSELAKAIWQRERGETFSKPTMLTITCLIAALMLYLAGRVILAGDMSFAALVLKATMLAFLAVAITRWFAAMAKIREATKASGEVFEFLERRGDVTQAVDAEFLQPMTRKLELIDVSLREPGTGRMILDKVSVSIPAGQRVAVISADPSESLAFAYLLTRFQDPTGGEVRIDGKNTRWVTYESIRAQVGLVLEQSLTFSDTIANNIGCGEPSYTLPRIIAAAKMAHAHQFIQRLPYGYETPIGDLGHSLKTGERYRIALARAILRDPSILLLQESAEALDADSLVLIDDTLARMDEKSTVLFLARRASTLQQADQVLVLQNGKLVASGRHQDLLQGNELYQQLHFKQSLAAGMV
ncbi:MAG: ABC transporter ATP-binding protein [Fimbriiglobus sp.]